MLDKGESADIQEGSVVREESKHAMQSSPLSMIGIRLEELLMHVDCAGLTHKITIVRGQGRQGAYPEDRSIRILV